MEEQDLDAKQLMAAWVLEHFDDPFPTPEEKDMLVGLTGMPRPQVSEHDSYMQPPKLQQHICCMPQGCCRKTWQAAMTCTAAKQ